MFPYTAQALGEAFRAIPMPKAIRQRTERAMRGAYRIQEDEPGIFSVQNLENGHVYTVKYNNEDGSWTCSCPDYQHRSDVCKHILAIYFRSGLVVADVDLAAGRSRIVPISLWKQDNVRQPQNGQSERSDMNQPVWMRQYNVGDDLPPLYPFIQWVNDGNALEPRQPTGGFASPVDQVQIGTYSYLHHRDGGHTEVTFTTMLRVAVLRTRFMDEGRRSAAILRAWSAWEAPGAVPGRGCKWSDYRPGHSDLHRSGWCPVQCRVSPICP